MGAQAAAALRAAALTGAPLGDLPAAPQAPGGPGDGLVLGGLPPASSLTRVALSSGATGLAPVAWDAAAGLLHRVLVLPAAGPVPVTVVQRGDTLVVGTGAPRRLDPGDRDALAAQVRRVVGADDALTGLRAAAAGAADALPGVAAEVAAGGGRWLRSPTVWEDLVKALAATRCSWAATRAACRRLVAAYGERGRGGVRAFPTPQAVAAVPADRLAATTGLGFRAPSLAALAAAVTAGDVDPEGWRSPGAGDAEVRAAVTGLRGLGPASADALLPQLGRPRGLGLDGWARDALADVLGLPAPAAAERAARRYAPLGRWAGTGLWLELAAAWTRPVAPSSASSAPPPAARTRGRAPLGAAR